MRLIGTDEAKQIQMLVLDVIHDYCIENGIRYSISCGTLLGAVRHKGYIPWDDDIDIYMLREDYDRLISQFPKEYKDVRIASLETDAKWDRPYANAYNVYTLKNEETTGYSIGMGIDIFPLDTLPEEDDDWIKFDKKRRFYNKIYVLKALRVSRLRPFKKNAIIVIAHILLLPISLRTVATIIDRYITKYKSCQTQYVRNCSQGTSVRPRFYKLDFEETIDMQFENRQYKAGKGWDRYLTLAFGDYMTLPPIEKRVTHHSYTAYWLD